MWHDFWTKNQKGIIFAVGMLLFLAAGLVVAGFPAPARNRPVTYDLRVVNNTAAPEPDLQREAGEASVIDDKPQEEWVLYITGAVRRPGVYNLPPGSRLLRLVEAAGGMDISADTTAVNLAAVLSDAMHVHIPSKGEEQPSREPYVGMAPGTAGGPSSHAARGAPGTLININRASAEELTALRGIGPALAGNIVDYRVKNGRFHSVEDLLNVSGIGHRRLEDLRDSVTVGP